MATGLRWLVASQGDAKHIGWAHPLVACVVYYLAVVPASWWASVWLGGTASGGRGDSGGDQGVTGYELGYWPGVCKGLVAYLAVLLGSRLVTKGSVVLYEFMWGCNVALVLGALAGATGNALLLAGAVVSVAVDQVMWYVDIAAYVITGSFPIGVAKYLIWPTTGWVQRATSGHHLAFIPLALWMLGEAQTGFPPGTFALSIVVLVVEGGATRLLAPFSIVYPSRPPLMLNINLTHECWTDVPFALLHIADGASFLPAMAWLVTVWSSTNAICYAVLLAIESVVYGV
ncbi:uncharacterized protein AMSG_01203 [Thecamonas trahens ATCC 50062]|uniref:Uncharacterized protein n=1 Tax=Thecamonas trahens ATCC 50062 TaxID=461836 RepID=A0A0L0DME1_THETB|nr:hypothetical protein AMSG_01203 [Thecamonas trahens ATCC 50062]KNC53489.1 hypothetical protein AMSG_01203 [Thecamonas trahens ATCC 50062]|eukprot:XP_013761811.1 hypothetical protein AMSG_01203 [Thecamonas trahens ATCC 50062]